MRPVPFGGAGVRGRGCLVFRGLGVLGSTSNTKSGAHRGLLPIFISGRVALLAGLELLDAARSIRNEHPRAFPVDLEAVNALHFFNVHEVLFSRSRFIPPAPNPALNLARFTRWTPALRSGTG